MMDVPGIICRDNNLKSIMGSVRSYDLDCEDKIFKLEEEIS